MFGKRIRYSKKWIENLSDKEFGIEREKVRLRHCNGEDNYDLLKLFDEVQIHRMNKKYEEEHPNAQTRHREHGWYLSSDDE